MIKIVHYVFRDIFATGYINFMVNSMNEYDHLFIMKSHSKVFKSGIRSNKADEIIVDPKAKMRYIEKDNEILDDPQIRDWIDQATRFIVSGLFDDLSYLLQLSDDVWKKTYLHFWGGDFYCFREKDMENASVKRIKDKEMVLEAIGRCGAVLNVVGTDYAKMQAILGIDKVHFEAPMPEHMEFRVAGSGCQNKESGKALRIVIGNSAASDNCHIEAFRHVNWLAKENVEIFCPLSYGELEYRNEVMEEGERIFGKKITFLTDFIPFDKYIDFLRTCDVGIYNTNRQQGFKNITTMLYMGKRVFIRKDTAIHEMLRGMGVYTNAIEDIVPHDLNVFRVLEMDIRNSNRKAIDAFVESYKGLWEYILNDRSRDTFLSRKNNKVSLNIHLTDHCNLNCKGCSHFSPIANEYFITRDELEDTLKQVKEIGENLFSEFCLMGGEPFLHPDIGELLALSRTYLKHLPIKLITNGLNLFEIRDSIWEICRNNDIFIEITCYPIAFDYDALLEYLKGKKVKAGIYVDRRDGEFRKDCLKENDDQNAAWNYAKCRIGGLYPQVRDGKLFRCATAANIHILNTVFNMSFEYDEGDYIPLGDIKSERDLKRFLCSFSGFCRYCDISKQHMGKWGISHKSIEEWIDVSG